MVQHVYDGQLAAHHDVLKKSLEVLRALPAQLGTAEVCVCVGTVMSCSATLLVIHTAASECCLAPVAGHFPGHLPVRAHNITRG